jgi:hypothetical protein
VKVTQTIHPDDDYNYDKFMMLLIMPEQWGAGWQ